MSTTSSALQDMTAHGAYRQVVASYWRYDYYDDLSEGLPVIDNTSTMTTWVKDYQLSTIQVQKWPMWSIYTLEISSALISIYIVYLPRYKVLILPYEVISLVIGIGQGLLARWQGLTFGMLSVLVRVY